MVAEGKPHPAPFLAGAALLGFAPQECVAVEDSTSGVAAGKAAGCTVIATTFTHPSDDLHQADYIVPDLTAITVAPQANQLQITIQQL
jgi:sugar-phosphatase